jgi:site-specific recombinase XerD
MNAEIETTVTEQSFVNEALNAMRDYRSWAAATFNSYRMDCEQFENFLYDIGVEPTLTNAKIHLVNKWIQKMSEDNASPGTIRRRLAALSSVFSFYMDLGIARSNPFKAVERPVGESAYHSALLELNEVKEVFRVCKTLRAQSIDIDLTVRMLFFTGLRNQALTNVKVKHVLLEQGMLQIAPKLINNKNKPQVIPLPPKLLEQIKLHIEHLQPEDTLLYGLNGQPLHEKQLNRITNRINNELGWEGKKRITPHGFRSSLSTLLSERGIDQVAIKLVLGHSDKEVDFHENMWIYIRKHKRFINLIRRELTAIEAELEGIQHQDEVKDKKVPPIEREAASVQQSILDNLRMDEEMLISLLQSYPKLAMEMIKQGIIKKGSSLV